MISSRQTGEFTWTPKAVRDYSVTFSVYDAREAYVAMTVGIKVVDTIAPATADDAPQGWVNHDVMVNLTATDSGSGGHRWGYYGDAKNITVKNSILWADIAHPTMIGTHGDYHGDGTLIENILFENIDILEHHEPQDGYRGCLTINAGDKNIVRHVTYRNIRIDPFELGRIIDIRVIWNPDYNPVPGNGIEHVEFDQIRYRGSEEVISSICGFDEDRAVKNVLMKNFYRNDIKVTDAVQGKVNIGRFATDVRFE